MLSAHDAADGRLHHGNDCDNVAAVLLSLSSRPDRSVVLPRLAASPNAEGKLSITQRYACDAVMCRPAAQGKLLIILRYACDAVMCWPAAQGKLLIILMKHIQR